MAEDTPKPGIKKVAVPRAEPFRPGPRVTPTAPAINPSEYGIIGEKETVYSDLPVDAPNDLTRQSTPVPSFQTPSLKPENVAVASPLLGLSQEQLQAIAEQLKEITMTAVKSSLPPPPGKRSIPVQVAKGTKFGIVSASVGVTVLGIIVEWAARTYLNVDGPWTEFIVTLGRVLQRAGN